MISAESAVRLFKEDNGGWTGEAKEVVVGPTDGREYNGFVPLMDKEDPLKTTVMRIFSGLQVCFYQCCSASWDSLQHSVSFGDRTAEPEMSRSIHTGRALSLPRQYSAPQCRGARASQASTDQPPACLSTHPQHTISETFPYPPPLSPFLFRS